MLLLLPDEQSSKQLTVSNVRTMKMDDDVLIVGVSPDGQKIAVALLDNTVKVALTGFLLSVC